MLKQIFNYINLGYAVFPVYSVIGGKCSCGNLACKSVGKHSKIGIGPTGAIKNLQVLANMYEFWSDSNIGIATGKISGIVVLDVDPRELKSAEFPSNIGLSPTIVAVGAKSKTVAVIVFEPTFPTLSVTFNLAV